MADVSQPKRPREEEISLQQEEETPQDLIKRQRTYNQLLSILEEDEEDLNNDNLSDIFTTLQHELFSSSSSSSDFSLNFDTISLPNFDVSEADQEPHKTTTVSSSKSMLQNGKEEDERFTDVLRHLLEASDDELGLPGAGGVYSAAAGGGDNNICFNDGLFEFEDETANYYAMLQSELFM